MQDHDPSKNPSIPLSQGKPSKPSLRREKAPKANAREARELLSQAMTNLYQTTSECRALQERVREVLAENRELRAALAALKEGR